MLPLIWKGWMRPAGQLARQTDMFCFDLESCFGGMIVELKEKNTVSKERRIKYYSRSVGFLDLY